MNLIRFWPTEANCLACIKPEAENPSDAVFLAVHQEMRFVRRSFNTKQGEKKTQQQLLSEFLRNEPSGRVILPILGESGIGKSHLVRWLDVQLRQRTDRDKRHVIRIPKSASLKSVLGRILEGLEGPRYEEIRTQLRAAREQMDEIGAKQRIRAELLTAIERNYVSASERKERARKSGTKLCKQDQLWLAHGEGRALPALLKDPATEVMFMRGTPSRPGIISELARHLTQDASEGDSPRRQFEEADFLVPAELTDEINEASPIAKRYLDKLQRTTSRKQLDEALALLNEIVDDAIAPLATPADTSLAELFYEVRRQLLVDGRELVLLVEDFAVLAGVQRALLDAILREGQTGGRAEACIIRTALAVTDGYFFSSNLETVQTRAVHGWWIESGEGEAEEIVANQISNFVAAYVNAARIGAERLEEHYSDVTNIGKRSPNAFDVLHPEEDELSVLANFGQSADHLSLFPFNRSSIRAIADWKLRDQHGRLRFHPRSVINEIILPVVKDSRLSFERGCFPPESFLGFAPTRISNDLEKDISRRESDQVKQEQYLYLLHFWGGQPETLADARLPQGVFEAFGLTPFNNTDLALSPEPLKPLPNSGGEPVKLKAHGKERGEVSPAREPLAVRTFVDKLNAWRGGEVLMQAEANRVRGWIRTHILHSINWEAELLGPIKPTTKTFSTSIYLPRAKGNPPVLETSFLVVASDEQFDDAKCANDVFSAIRAMVRYDHYNGWDYAESANDYVALSNFVDRHLSQATSWIRGKYDNADGSRVGSLTQALLWQARQLNVETAHKSDDASQIDAIFADAPARLDGDDDPEWSEFLGELTAIRKLLQNELLSYIAAFQGAGKTPYAIDASQLLDVIQNFRKTWEVCVKFPQLQNTPSDEFNAIERHIKLIIRSGNKMIENRRRRISDQSRRIIEELGKEYDKNELINDLEEVCVLSEKHGLHGTVTVGQVRKLIEKFKGARVKEVGVQVDAIINSEDLATRMTALARLDTQTLALLVEFAKTCSEFIRERASRARNQILDWSPEVVEAKKTSVDDILRGLEDAVTPFQKVDV